MTILKIIPLTEAKARFSEIIERLIHMREKVVIAKRNSPVAVIVPYDEWILRASQKPEGLAAAASALSDLDDEIATMTGEIYEARRKAKGRSINL